jgi:ribosomal protein L25 (general stress protein Ctc)
VLDSQAPKKKPSAPVDEKVWIERLTKKEDKKKGYEDPHNTFKPQISKQTEKMIAKMGTRDAFTELMQDSKKRIEKDRLKGNHKERVDNIKAQEKSIQILYHKFEKVFDKAYAEVIKVSISKEEEEAKKVQ